MPQEPITSEFINYPVDAKGALVTRRPGLSRMKPKLDAPPANQPGSVDWTMTTLFGSRAKALAMVESLVAGQGENADEKWVRFCLLYRKWEQEGLNPTFNQVCHSLDFDASIFVSELQTGLQNLMVGISKMKASMMAPNVINNLNMKAVDPDASDRVIELQLKVAGVIEEKSGVNVNVTQQNAVLLKGEREKMKSPLRQFSATVTEIDNEVRKEHGIISLETAERAPDPGGVGSES